MSNAIVFTISFPETWSKVVDFLFQKPTKFRMFNGFPDGGHQVGSFVEIGDSKHGDKQTR